MSAKFASFGVFLCAVQALALESPLTLERALELGRANDVKISEHALLVEAAAVGVYDLEAIYDPDLSLDLAFARRESFDENIDDSHHFLQLRKTWFDADGKIDIAAQKSALLRLRQQEQQLRLENEMTIMSAFFAVILADLEYETALQDLAVAAVLENRVQEDFDLLDASEVLLLEKRTDSEHAVKGRIVAETKQFSARVRLAELLGVDFENRPDDVQKPDLEKFWQHDFGEFSAVREAVLENNIELKILQNEQSDIEDELQAQKNNDNLRLDSYLRLGQQADQRDKNGSWRIGLRLTMPLADDDQERKIQKLNIEARRKNLEIKNLREKLTREALRLWSELALLRQEKDALAVEADYRDIFLEKARADYELEITSHLGSAMTELTRTEYKVAKNAFDYVITWKKLNLLAGGYYEN